MILVQLGRGMSVEEVSARAIGLLSDYLDGPIHFVRMVVLEADEFGNPRRAIIEGVERRWNI